MWIREKSGRDIVKMGIKCVLVEKSSNWLLREGDDKRETTFLPKYIVVGIKNLMFLVLSENVVNRVMDTHFLVSCYIFTTSK